MKNHSVAGARDMTRARIKSTLLAVAGGCLALSSLALYAEAPPVSFGHPARFVAKDGATLYRAACQGCHMPDGKGAIGAGQYPALANNPRLQAASYPAFLILNGQRAMPEFGSMLDDEQVASIVTYIRTHFGNQYTDPVTPADVKVLRR